MLKELYSVGFFGYYCNGGEFDTSVFFLLCAASVLICIAVGYFLGSINTSIIVSKLFYGEDVRNYGSGNAGATNVLRTYGKKSALLTTLGDVLKTVIAVVIGCFVGFPLFCFSSNGAIMQFGGYIAGLFAVVGHTFPIYYKFKGGKGVLCAATAVAILSPLLFVFLMLIFAFLVIGTKYVSLGSVVAVMAYPILLDRMYGHSICILLAFMIAALVVYNHRSNLRRVLNRTENKISIGKKDKQKKDATESEGDGE